jgi:hypothetical protein
VALKATILELLPYKLELCLANKEKLQQMKDAAAKIAKPNAAVDIIIGSLALIDQSLVLRLDKGLLNSVPDLMASFYLNHPKFSFVVGADKEEKKRRDIVSWVVSNAVKYVTNHGKIWGSVRREKLESVLLWGPPDVKQKSLRTYTSSTVAPIKIGRKASGNLIQLEEILDEVRGTVTGKQDCACIFAVATAPDSVGAQEGLIQAR